jgi:hypothetical protein
MPAGFDTLSGFDNSPGNFSFSVTFWAADLVRSDPLRAPAAAIVLRPAAAIVSALTGESFPVMVCILS